MPKVRGTRKQRARELVKMLELGPAFSDLGGQMPFAPKQAAEQYARWVRSWILPTASDLIPELKAAKKGAEDGGDDESRKAHD